MDETSKSIDEPSATHVAIAVVEHENRLIIGRRPAAVPLAGFWEFPGGKVNDAETAAQCAARECLEETGLKIEVLALYTECTHAYEHGRLQIQFFKCRPRNAEQQPRPPYRWVHRRELCRYEFPPANQALLKMLAECSP
jgi:8-oxo-dGTP diphosphatase